MTHSKTELAVLSPPDAIRVQTADGLAKDWRDTADARFQPNLWKAAAQDRMTRIQGNLNAAEDDFLEGVRAEDWKTLGYPDMEAWSRALLHGRKLDTAVRQSVVAELTAAGKTVHEIEAATGAGKSTIGRDQQKAGVPSGTQAKATPRQKAARKREAKKPKKPAAQAPPPAKKPAAPAPHVHHYSPPGQNLPEIIRAVVKEIHTGDLSRPPDEAENWNKVSAVRLDKNDQAYPAAWTVTAPPRSRAAAAAMAGRLRVAAGDLTTLPGCSTRPPSLRPGSRRPPPGNG